MCYNHTGQRVTTENELKYQTDVSQMVIADLPGADLGFYKGGCPIHLKGAPPPNYFDPYYRNQTIFGIRRNSWRQAVVRHLELCQIPY